jgi:small membrane protein
MNISFLPIRIIFFILLLWPISRVWLKFKDGGVKIGMFVFWVGVWSVGVFSLFFPGFLTYLASVLGIGRGIDLVMYIAIAVVFYLVFRTNVIIEDIRNDISKIVREIAIDRERQKHQRIDEDK